MDAVCRIEMLGWLRAEQSGRVITRFRTYKTGALLAYLAYYPRPHPREHLIGMLWPDDNSEAGRNSLSKALSSLRHQLEPPGVPTGTVLRADRATIELNCSACTTDVADFEAALRAAARTADREKGSSAAAGAAPLLADAVQLYRGELLPGFYEDWNLTERQRLAEAYLEAVRRLIAHLEQIGEVRRAIEYAHQAIRADPLREESHAALIRLYVAAGDQAAALRQYQELERLLEKDVGVPPSRATRALIPHTPGTAGAVPAAAAPPIATATAASSPAPSAWQPFSSLPLGTVTFLLADSETGGEVPSALRDVCRRHGGFEVLSGGNTLVAAFGRATDAVVCAVAGQRALADAPLGAPRIVVHTGEAPKDESGANSANSASSMSSAPVVEDATRLLLAAHPGQILCSEATAALLRRDGEPGLQLTDRGIYRLRGEGEPERLFEVRYAGQKQQEFPAPQAEPGFKDNLPLLLTRFFGREEELARLSALLQGNQAAGGQLVTLTGPGGTGKTRLSVEAARRLLGPFQGAVWFVPLADLWDGRLVIEAIMDSLGIARRPEGNMPTDSLKQVIETLSRQKSLLILDNFEQLLREDDPHAEQAVRTVRTLRDQVPPLSILVSSRQRLGLTGEREFPVTPLSTPQAADETAAAAPLPDSAMPEGAAISPETLMRYESVQLFVDRAQAVQPDFQVTTGNAAAVAALCARLEGLPLAVELAAARAQVLTPAQMLAQLENRFQFLVSRQRDATLRHKTLRAAIDWSYRLLSPDLQRFFARLSVFRGGYTHEAVEAVCGEPDTPGMALDYLSLLVECSLVVADTQSATGSGGMGETRFRMLEMLRQYAEDTLPPDDRGDIKKRHARYFQQLAEKAEAALLGPEQGAWLLRLEAEHDNLRAVLAWSRTESGAAEIGLRVAAALWRFWWIRGYRSEGREQMAQLLALPGGSAPPGVRAKVFAAAGTLARLQGDYEAAVSLLHQGLDLQRREGDKQGVAASLNSLGLVSFEQGDYSTARALFEEGLTIFRELGDRKGIAYALNTLGFVFSNQGNYAQARPLFEESLSIRRALGDRQGVASSLNNLGNIPLLEGDYAAARPLFEESLALKRELGDKQGIPLSLNSLGYLALLQGDAATAGPLFAESLEIFREMGDKQGVATALNNLGDVAVLREDFAGARPLFTENLGIVREMGDQQGIAYSLEGWARLAAAQKRHERAVRLWAATQKLREAINTPLPPADRAYYERAVAAVRAQMEDTAFAAAWEYGSALSAEEAIIYALADI